MLIFAGRLAAPLVRLGRICFVSDVYNAWVVAICGAFMLAMTASAVAAPDAAVVNGSNWLAAQVQATGGVTGEVQSLAEIKQVRGEVAQTLRLLGAPVPPSLSAATSVALTDITELLARHVLETPSPTHVTALIGRQLSGGGFASQEGHEATALDTAWALRALSGNAVLVSKAVSWLQTQQRSDGSWADAPNSAVYTTAIVLRSLQDVAAAHPSAVSLTTPAVSFLLSQRSADGSWSQSNSLTGLVFEALHPFAGNETLNLSVRGVLLASQLANGSWQSDPYVTAVALRGLHLTFIAPLSPALANISGTVVDAATGLPLNSVNVAIYLDTSSTSLATQSTQAGAYAFTNLQPGRYRLVYQYPEHLSQAIEVNVNPGQTLQLPTIQLVKPTGAAATRGTIRGFVQLATDASPVAGAQIQLSPGIGSVTTGADGAFQFTNVQPGAVTVTVSKSGLSSQTANIQLLAGDTYIYIAQMQAVGSPPQPPATTPSGLTGKVLDAGTQSPIDGAQIAAYVNGVEVNATTSDSEGKFKFDALSSAQVTLLVNKAGYGGSRADLFVPPNTSLNLGIFQLTKDGVSSLLPNLTVRQVSKKLVVVDPQSLVVGGKLIAEVRNVGALTTPAGAKVVAFEDRNANGTFERGLDLVLGEATLDTTLLPNQGKAVELLLAGVVLFRDNLIHVMVDSERTIPETVETDNIGICSCSTGLPLLDDFSDGDTSNWQPVVNHVGALGVWTEKDGVYESNQGGASFFGDPLWKDYDVQIRVNFPDGASNDAGLLFRVKDEKNWYQLRIKDSHVRLLEFIDGSWSAVVEKPMTVEGNRWYVLKAEVRGKKVRGLIDGQPVFEYDNLLIDQGHVGVEQDGVRVQFDDLRVFDAPFFEQNFNDGTAPGWSALPYGTAPASVANGKYVRDGMGSSSVGSQQWTNIMVQHEMQFPNGTNNDGGLIFRAHGTSGEKNAWVTLNGNLVRMSYSGIGVVRSTVVPISTDPNHLYTFRAEIVGSKVSIFLNDNFLFSDDSLPWPDGAVGTSQDGVLVHYDNLRVYRSGGEAPDLTASFVRVTDGGVGQPSSVTVRIGNGGTLQAPAGVPVAFYSGDPQQGGTLLGTAVLSKALNPSEFEDVSFNLPVALSSLQRLWIVADDDGTGKGQVLECDELNNSVSVNASLLAVNLKLQVTTDKTSYTDADQAIFTVKVNNAGSFAKDATVALSVHAPDGREIAQLGPLSMLAIAPAGQGSASATWLAKGWLAGAGYKVKATLISPLTVSSIGGITAGSQPNQPPVGATNAATSAVAGPVAEAPFSIIAGVALSASVQTDKAVYQANDVVRITPRVTNTTTNLLVNGLSAQTSVRDATGALVWSKVEPLESLAPGAVKEFTYSLPLSAAKAGAYGITFALVNSAAEVQRTATGQFSVANSATNASSLSATLTASPASVAAGAQLVLGWSLLNQGNAAYNALPVTVRVVDPTAATPAQALVAQFSSSPTVGLGQSLYSESWTVPATQAGKSLVAALLVTVGGQTVTLAQANFQVTAAPRPSFQLSTELHRESRVLALVSCRPSETGPEDANCAAARSEALRATLTALGIVHKVVTSRAEFETDMRCGLYNTYWISGGAAKLTDNLVKQLREAVRRGDGLVLDGEHDSRNALLHPVAGVKQQGKLNTTDLALTFPGTAVYPAGSLATLGRPTKFELVGGQSHATFSSPGDQGDTPAVVSNLFGQGRSIVFAFDLLRMLAEPAGGSGSSNTAHQDLVRRALDHVASTARDPVIGAPVAVRATVLNSGSQAKSVQLIGQLPVNATYLGASAEAAGIQPNDQRQVIWALSLAPGESRSAILRLSLSQAGSQQLVFRLVESGAAAASPVLATESHQLNAQAPLEVAQQALAAVNAIPAGNANEAQAKAQALRSVQQAQASLQQQDPASALQHWLRAADQLLATAPAATPAAALAVARSIQSAQRALCPLLACMAGDVKTRLNGQIVTEAPVGSNLLVTRSVRNGCAAPLSSWSVSADLSNRRTGKTEFTLQDTLNLNGLQTLDRSGNWVAGGLAGDWIDSVLTAQWQDFFVQLDRRSLLLTLAPTLICDIDRNGQVDRNDISRISSVLNTRVELGDPRDVNGDGLINILDVRQCTLKCTKPNCAP